MATRPADKAYAWYEGNPKTLGGHLDGFLAAVPDNLDESALPIVGARVIIAPHAGYNWSGPCAAWAYSCLDLSHVKRVFVLGPSHTYYLEGCAVSTFAKYATPFGDLIVDQETSQRLKEAGDMDDMPSSKEIKEHSLEMHMPYLFKRCQQTFSSPDEFPSIVPILIGDNTRQEEKDVGRILLSYLKDPENAFIASSDFCHWGKHFSYTVYSAEGDPSKLKMLDPDSKRPSGPPIYETIRLIDEAALNAVKSGSHDAFVDNLRLTKNTVCGRHPIGVMMAALELWREENVQESVESGGKLPKGRFSIVQYSRSNDVEEPSDFSVSYVSAYAVL